MNYLVDSKTIIDFFSGKTELFHLFDNEENIYVSVVTQGELFYKAGLIESDCDVVRVSSDFCHLMHIISIDERIALEYGKLKISYPELEQNKLWLCATAIIRDLVIVSDDEDISKVTEVVVKRF